MNDEIASVSVKEIAINFLDGKVQVHVMTEDGYWRVLFNHKFSEGLGKGVRGRGISLLPLDERLLDKRDNLNIRESLVTTDGDAEHCGVSISFKWGGGHCILNRGHKGPHKLSDDSPAITKAPSPEYVKEHLSRGHEAMMSRAMAVNMDARFQTAAVAGMIFACATRIEEIGEIEPSLREKCLKAIRSLTPEIAEKQLELVKLEGKVEESEWLAQTIRNIGSQAKWEGVCEQRTSDLQRQRKEAAARIAIDKALHPSELFRNL